MNQNWSSGFINVLVTDDRPEAGIKADDEMASALTHNEFGSGMEQGLGASGALDGVAEVTRAKEILRVAAVTRIIER